MNKIFLIRHAQSESNIDLNILRKTTNIGVHLTSIGHMQAQRTALELVTHLKNKKETIKIWHSPYFRTRETAEHIKNTLIKENITFSEEESIYLCERQFGLLDDNHENEITHKKELEHFHLHLKNEHEFWVRPPLGESPFDMCLRLDNFIRTVLYEKQFDNHIIISHGAAIKGFITMKQKLPFENYSKMKLPPNASINLIDNADFKGEIFSPNLNF